jgi:hypothetical protein
MNSGQTVSDLYFSTRYPITNCAALSSSPGGTFASSATLEDALSTMGHVVTEKCQFLPVGTWR